MTRHRGDTAVIVLANSEKLTVHLPGTVPVLFENTIKGSLFGSADRR